VVRQEEVDRLDPCLRCIEGRSMPRLEDILAAELLGDLIQDDLDGA